MHVFILFQSTNTSKSTAIVRVVSPGSYMHHGGAQLVMTRSVPGQSKEDVTAVSNGNCATLIYLRHRVLTQRVVRIGFA
jgi:hypothetical protein